MRASGEARIARTITLTPQAEKHDRQAVRDETDAMLADVEGKAIAWLDELELDRSKMEGELRG